MPTLRKLSVDEVHALETRPPSGRSRVAAEYDEYLAGFGAGDHGEVGLDEADNRLTIRKRLQAAATRRDLALTFKRTNGLNLRFQVITPSSETVHTTGINGTNTLDQIPATIEAPEPETSDPIVAAVPKRRGRPPRNSG